MKSPCVAPLCLCLLLAARGSAQTTPESPLPAAQGWRAAQIHKADSGVWYAHIDKVVDAYGSNDVIAADDKGRHLLLTVYSGQWTVHAATPDGLWLAPTKSADVDPRIPGRELYAGGRGGSVHRTILRPQPFAKFSLESVEIGHAAGEEFHTVLAADLLPKDPGDELLAFGISGAVFRCTPIGDGAAFAMARVGAVPGRVRDALVVSAAEGGSVRAILGVSRSGDLLQMELASDGLRHSVLLHEDCGLGRLSRSPVERGVFYATRDDGVVLRVVVQGDKVVERRAIFAGDQGLRGIAAGRFFADGREAVSVYGYGKKVHLLAKRPDGTFTVATLFEGTQQGHWLCAGELDGRNSTDELIATGFDGQIVLLAREPGYGLPRVAVADDAAPLAAPAAGVAGAVEPRALRIAARFGDRMPGDLSPLCYRGGFESKAMVYETLVTRGAGGRIAPGLAAQWRRSQDGKTVTFAVREGASFHDGTPVTAAAVVQHFRRWVGLPEHDWLRSNQRIVAVRALGERELAIDLDRPWALLPDLCAINPTAIRGPGALSREGEFVRPVGSGPFAFVEVREDGRVLRYRRHGGVALVDLVRVEGDPLDALHRGDVDAVVGSWLVAVDPAKAAALRDDRRFQVVDGPGSSMRHLALRTERGPLQSIERRRAVAAAIDRAELVRVVEHGFADASRGWAAPSIADWPQGAAVAAVDAPFDVPLRLVASAADGHLAAAVAAQLERRGIRVAVVPPVPEAEWDLRFERTHGVPYDPFLTVIERFAAAPAQPTAATPVGLPLDAPLAGLVEGLAAETDEKAWPAHQVRIQQRLDEVLPIVPLYAPRRIAVVRAGLPLPTLTHDSYGVDAKWLLEAAK